MGLKKKLFDLAVKPAQLLFKNPNKINCMFLDKVNMSKKIATPYGDLKISSSNFLTYWRANTLFTKEPDTIAWIDHFDKDDIFVDIGANIGLYSIYAALKGNKTYCFEPESQNYAELNKNIYLNSLSNKISAFNVALSDKLMADYLNISQFMTGYSMHNFSEAKGFDGEAFVPAFKQSVCGFPLDHFLELFSLPTPNHIKIDVDGIEAKVVEGARETLKKDQLKTVLIELNEGCSQDDGIVDLLKGYGFKVVSKYHAPMTSSKFENVYNYIFSKNNLELDY